MSWMRTMTEPPPCLYYTSKYNISRAGKNPFSRLKNPKPFRGFRPQLENLGFFAEAGRFWAEVLAGDQLVSAASRQLARHGTTGAAYQYHYTTIILPLKYKIHSTLTLSACLVRRRTTNARCIPRAPPQCRRTAAAAPAASSCIVPPASPGRFHALVDAAASSHLVSICCAAWRLCRCSRSHYVAAARAVT